MLIAVVITSMNCQTAFINIQMLAPVTGSLLAVSTSETLTKLNNLTEIVI